jgi:hypothetical protein
VRAVSEQEAIAFETSMSKLTRICEIDQNFNLNRDVEEISSSGGDFETF